MQQASIYNYRIKYSVHAFLVSQTKTSYVNLLFLTLGIDDSHALTLPYGHLAILQETALPSGLHHKFGKFDTLVRKMKEH